jgi:HlyD family secretion protein
MRRLRKLLLAVLLPLILVGGGVAFLLLRSRPRPNLPQTTVVKRGDVLLTVGETGRVQPVRSVEVKSKVAGLLAQLAVELGDRVEKGQLLARLDVPELKAQRDQVKAQLAAAAARLEQARLSHALGRKLVQSQIEQAKAALRAAESGLEQAGTRLQDAERAYERKRLLLERGGYISQDEVDTAKAAADLAAQERSAVREHLREQEAALAIAEARQAEAEVNRSRIAEAEASLRQIQNSLAEIESRLGDATIRAPCSGVILASHVREGELVTAVSYYGAGAPLVTIGDTSTMLVEVNLNEVDIDKVRLGQPVQITADALPRRSYQGRVTRISPVSLLASDRPGVVRFPVEIEILSPRTDLRPGMTADVEIKCERARGVLWVPNDALFKKKGTDRVAVVVGEKQGKRETEDRGVVAGLANEARTEIRSGLREGEKVELGRAGLPKRKKLEILKKESGEEE